MCTNCQKLQKCIRRIETLAKCQNATTPIRILSVTDRARSVTIFAASPAPLAESPANRQCPSGNHARSRASTRAPFFAEVLKTPVRDSNREF